MSKEFLNNERFLELDVWRGLAVLAMIMFHIFFFLNYFEFIEITYWKGAWKIFARVIQWSFFLLVGIGLHLSYQHHVSSGKPFSNYLKKLIKRSLIVFTAGMLVTFFTGILFPEDTIYFGALHFIAVSLFLVGFVAPRPSIASMLAALIFGASFIVNEITTDVFSLMPIGFQLIGFRTFDYFPLIPWIAIPLLGVFFGSILYPKAMPRFRVQWLTPKFPIRALSWLGQHALIVYLIHTPIIIALLSLIKQVMAR